MLFVFLIVLLLFNLKQPSSPVMIPSSPSHMSEKTISVPDLSSFNEDQEVLKYFLAYSVVINTLFGLDNPQRPCS